MAWKIAERSARARVAVGAAYAAYFLALFAQFPRAGRLPGNCDTWYAIAFTDRYPRTSPSPPRPGAPAAASLIRRRTRSPVARRPWRSVPHTGTGRSGPGPAAPWPSSEIEVGERDRVP